MMITDTSNAKSANMNSNRRGSARHAEPGGSALCRTGSSTQRYRIRDASKTGIALDGGPPLAVGTQVQIDLSWPMIGAATGFGVVCRRAEREVALRYTDITGVADLIGNIEAIEQRRREEPMPLLCGSGDELRLAIDTLDEAGFDFARVNSPLSAMQVLQDPWNPITSVILSPTLRWLDFSDFLGSEYPQLRRVMLNPPDSGADSKLAIDHSIVDLALPFPCPPKSLFQALGLRLGDQACLSCKTRWASSVSPFCSECRRRSTDLDLLDDLGGGD
jgi:hypothetical protein